MKNFKSKCRMHLICHSCTEHINIGWQYVATAPEDSDNRQQPITLRGMGGGKQADEPRNTSHSTNHNNGQIERTQHKSYILIAGRPSLLIISRKIIRCLVYCELEKQRKKNRVMLRSSVIVSCGEANNWKDWYCLEGIQAGTGA